MGSHSTGYEYTLPWDYPRWYSWELGRDINNISIRTPTTTFFDYRRKLYSTRRPLINIRRSWAEVTSLLCFCISLPIVVARQVSWSCQLSARLKSATTKEREGLAKECEN